MIIRFLTGADKYNAREVAGFLKPDEEKIARDYVRRGIAQEVARDEESGEWVPVENTADETDSVDGDAPLDLASLSRDELVAMAEELEVEVERADGKDGKPTMEDYVRVLTEASETSAAAATEDDSE